MPDRTRRRKWAHHVAALVGVAVGATALAESYDVPSTVPREQPAAKILAEVVVYKQAGKYLGWPTVVLADNGDLIAVFSADRDWHVCPWGTIRLVRSSDGGKTWTDAELVIDTPLDDRDAGLTKLSDGTLVVHFNTTASFDDPKIERYAPYREHAASLTPEVRERWLGAWTMRSTDQGRTWSEPTPIPTGTPHGPAALRNGGMVIVRPSVYESHDAGLTWNHLADIERDPQTWQSRYAFLSEQHAIELDDGRLLALSRYADRANTDIDLRQIESTDGGRSWSAPVATGMRGYPAHLLQLENGWLLASYGRRIDPNGQRATVSKDGGRTWLVDQEVVLSNAVPQKRGDLGYPASAQLPDGSIWTLYYQVEKESDGEFPCIMGTHWRLRE